jgi:hypothetical protein
VTAVIPIRLAVEDILSESVLRRVLAGRPVQYEIGAVYRRGGFGYLKRQSPGFNTAAKVSPFLLLTDLDRYECPPLLVRDWLGHSPHPHFLFRVAVREVESWLLAETDALAKYLGLRRSEKIGQPETIADPKEALLRLALQARSRIMRDALVWQDKGSGQLYQGPDYNGVLTEFVMKHWNAIRAHKQCPSLKRLLIALARLENDFGGA